MTEGSELGNRQFNYDEDRHWVVPNTQSLLDIGTKDSLAHLAFMQTSCWPHVVKEGLGYDLLINNAMGGSSNQKIMRRSIFDITQLLEDHEASDIQVIIGWSGISRYEMVSDGQYFDFLPDQLHRAKLKDYSLLKLALNIDSCIPIQLTRCFQDFIHCVVVLRSFLREKGIPFVFCLGVADHISSMWDTPSVNNLINDPYMGAMFPLLNLEADWFLYRCANYSISHCVNNWHKFGFRAMVEENSFPCGNGNHPLEEGHWAWGQELIHYINNCRHVKS